MIAAEEDELGVDFDSFFNDLDGFAELFDFESPPAAELSPEGGDPELVGGLPSSGSCTIPVAVRDIERFLLEEAAAEVEVADDGVEEFFAGVFGGGSREETASSGSVKDDRMEKIVGEAEAQAKAEEENFDGDDPTSKKRRRQMRNRDSAMKSRERKKLYVKELEIKKNYMESECKRLVYALQLCMAENMVLHQRLQQGNAHGAFVAGQESAVLFVESLLLGSLFWLISIVSLFLLPGLPSSNPADPRETVKLAREGKSRLSPDSGRPLLGLPRRRCNSGTKFKTKMCLFFPLHEWNYVSGSVF